MNSRLLNILLNGARTFILPVSTFFISYIVIKTFGENLWGDFVGDLLLVNILAMLLQWGNKEFLIRSYSQSPSAINSTFYSNLFTRGLILIPIIILLLFLSSNSYQFILLVVWLISLFFYQSSESIIIYEHFFQKQLYLEILSLTLIFTGIFLTENLTKIKIVELFALANIVKAIGAWTIIYPKFKKGSIQMEHIFKALPFIIIGLSGFLQSRVDQYIIALYEDKSTTGIYQVFLSSFILLQSISAIIIIPFNKLLYRVNEKTFNQLMKRMLVLSSISVVFLGTLISLLLVYIFEFNIPIYYLATGILFAFPPFIYVPIIYQFYRAKKEKEVVIVNYIGALFNLLITFIVVFYQHPIAAIAGGAFAQWSMLIWYLKRKKAILHEIKMSGMSTPA